MPGLQFPLKYKPFPTRPQPEFFVQLATHWSHESLFYEAIGRAMSGDVLFEEKIQWPSDLVCPAARDMLRSQATPSQVPDIVRRVVFLAPSGDVVRASLTWAEFCTRYDDSCALSQPRLK